MDSDLDPSMTGVIVGVVSGSILILTIVIGVAVTCYIQKRDRPGFIIANLRAKRIHVLQTTRSNHSSFRGSNRQSHASLRHPAAGEAEVRIVRAVSRSAGSRKHSHSESKEYPIEIRKVKSADGKRRRSSDTAMPDARLLAAAARATGQQKEKGLVLIPSNLPVGVRPKEEDPDEQSGKTTNQVMSFRAFESPIPDSLIGSPRDLQHTSIIIDPRANMQTTIILDDTSSVATSLPCAS